jgi:hypothetical protein
MMRNLLFVLLLVLAAPARGQELPPPMQPSRCQPAAAHAAAFARSSCPPGAWSMLSGSPRATRRSSPHNCAINGGWSSKSRRPELSAGKRSRYKSDFGLGATS